MQRAKSSLINKGRRQSAQVNRATPVKAKNLDYIDTTEKVPLNSEPRPISMTASRTRQQMNAVIPNLLGKSMKDISLHNDIKEARPLTSGKLPNPLRESFVKIY